MTLIIRHFFGDDILSFSQLFSQRPTKQLQTKNNYKRTIVLSEHEIPTGSRYIIDNNRSGYPDSDIRIETTESGELDPDQEENIMDQKHWCKL